MIVLVVAAFFPVERWLFFLLIFVLFFGMPAHRYSVLLVTTTAAAAGQQNNFFIQNHCGRFASKTTAIFSANVRKNKKKMCSKLHLFEWVNHLVLFLVLFAKIRIHSTKKWPNVQHLKRNITQYTLFPSSLSLSLSLPLISHIVAPCSIYYTHTHTKFEKNQRQNRTREKVQSKEKRPFQCKDDAVWSGKWNLWWWPETNNTMWEKKTPKNHRRLTAKPAVVVVDSFADAFSVHRIVDSLSPLRILSLHRIGSNTFHV